jgi:hypothetical protein
MDCKVIHILHLTVFIVRAAAEMATQEKMKNPEPIATRELEGFACR